MTTPRQSIIAASSLVCFQSERIMHGAYPPIPGSLIASRELTRGDPQANKSFLASLDWRAGCASGSARTDLTHDISFDAKEPFTNTPDAIAISCGEHR
jgi:hypothetical protein